MNQEAEPPFIRDGELVVRCDHSGCNQVDAFGIDVDGATSSDDGTGWRISFVPTSDGRLEVDNVECPRHRVSDAIDDLVEAQADYAKSLSQTKQMVEKVTPDN